MEILWLGIGFLMLMEKKSLGERCSSTDKNFILREGSEESIKNKDEEVLGGSCIKGKFYKYSN